MFLIIEVNAQTNKITENKYQQYFAEAYKLYPQIPRGILESVAFTKTHFTDIDEKFAPSPLGIPKVWGVMGLTFNGKNYFRENLKFISKLSGYSSYEIMHNTRLNIIAYAKAFSVLSKQKKIVSENPVDFLPILIDLSELPIPKDDNILNEFALLSELYSVIVFLDDDFYSNLFDFPDYNIDKQKVFGDNLSILSAHKIEINDIGIFDEKGNEFHSKLPTTVCPDYNVSHCSWIASPNFSSRSGTPISSVVIHTMQGAYSSCLNWFQNPNANASTHYVIRSFDGQITQMVHESDKAWHVRTENPYTIGYEHEGYVETDGWYTVEMYNSSADLTRDVCDAYGINPHRMFYRDTLDDGDVLDYGLHPLAGTQYCVKIAGHQHFPNNTHTDPGPYWNWNYYYRLVNEGLGAETVFTKASGLFYDEGGISGDYLNDERNIYLIKPANSEKITLTFDSFDLEKDWDFMYIYDGDNVFAPLLGRWNTQSPGTVISSGNSLLIEFRSDCATVKSGWKASWSTKSANVDSVHLVTVSPNPFVDDFFVTINQSFRNVYFSLISVTGKKYNIKYNNENNVFKIIVQENIPNGVYVLRILVDDKLIAEKIIKTN